MFMGSPDKTTRITSDMMKALSRRFLLLGDSIAATLSQTAVYIQRGLAWGPKRFTVQKGAGGSIPATPRRLRKTLQLFQLQTFEAWLNSARR